MEKSKRSRISNIIIFITICIIILTTVGIVLFFIVTTIKGSNEQGSMLEDTSEHNKVISNYSSNKADTFRLSSKQIIKCYSIKVAKKVSDNPKSYMLDSSYSATMLVVSDTDYKLKISINNGTKVIEDNMLYSDYEEEDPSAFTINFYRVGDYIVFKSHNATGERHTHLYVFDKQGNLYKDIYELDENNKGMVVDKVEFKGNSIIVHSSTTTYTYSIDSNGNIDFNKPIVTKK